MLLRLTRRGVGRDHATHFVYGAEPGVHFQNARARSNGRLVAALSTRLSCGSIPVCSQAIRRPQAIETQNDGNHIHSVWRDFNGDFGRDLLRDHLVAVAH